MRVVEQQLIAGYLVDQADKNHLDALAWLCNILGSTKDGKYYSTLEAVANSNANRKVKKYASKNKRYLK